MEHSRCDAYKREGLVVRWIAWAIEAFLKPKVRLVAENLCLRQQLVTENLVLRHQVSILRRRASRRLSLSNADRLTFVWLYRLCPSAVDAVAIIRPETVIRTSIGRGSSIRTSSAR
jgi:hypothetical protein